MKNTIIKRGLIKLLKLYKKGISPLLPDACRYWPTCSVYMMQAIEKHGVIKGIIMGTARIFRCNPFVKGGVDPVPDNFTLRRNRHPERYEDPIISEKFHKGDKNE